MNAETLRPRMPALLICVMLGLASCKQAPADTAQPPVLDMIAVADFDTGADFSQVLLKLQLLHTRADILKFGIRSPEEHQARINYYRDHFKNEIFLVSGADTLPCYDVHAERLYMDLPYMNFILAFNHPVSRGDELLIHDIVYSNQSVLVAIEPKMQPQ
jgi:hypothetical protein